MEHLVSQVLDLSLRTVRACQEGCRASTELRTLLRGLGYTMDNLGDLSAGARYGGPDTRRVFHRDALFLKSLLAAAFSDQLLLGCHGALPTPEAAVAKPSKAAKKATARLQRHQLLLQAVEKEKMVVQHAAVFATKEGTRPEEMEGYVDFVC